MYPRYVTDKVEEALTVEALWHHLKLYPVQWDSWTLSSNQPNAKV